MANILYGYTRSETGIIIDPGKAMNIILIYDAVTISSALFTYEMTSSVHRF